MVNFISVVRPLLHTVMKLAGLSQQQIKLGQDTVINIWAPIQSKPDKPAIVLTHGFFADGILSWFPQMLALAGTYAVHVPDLLFFGGSTTSSTERSMDFQAACLAECLRILEVHKCTVVGFSYGGIVAFKMAELYPSLVENLVVSGSVAKFTRSINEEAFREIGVESWVEFLLPESVDGIKRLFAFGIHKLPWLPDFLYKDFLEALFDNRSEKAEVLEALVVNDKDSITLSYPQKIHFLWGDEDKIFKLELAQTMKEKIGEKASLKWIEDAGHLVQLERPFSYIRELKKILAAFYPNSL